MDTEKQFKNVGGFKQTFRWLMERLLAPSDLIKGCELIFPDTAFFERGQLVLMIKMDKDFCLQGTRNPKKLTIQILVKNFQEVLKERKREQGIFQQKYGAGLEDEGKKDLTIFTHAEKAKDDRKTGSTTRDDLTLGKAQQLGAINSGMPTSVGGSRQPLRDELPQMANYHKVFYADEALVRFRESSENSRSPNRDQSQPQSATTSDAVNQDLANAKHEKKPSRENAVNIMDGTACSAMFTKDNRMYRPDHWKKEFDKVCSVQTNVRAQLGCGTPIFVNFFAPLNLEKYGEPVVYDFRSFGEDLYLIRDHGEGWEQLYCLKQCYKMCFYVQKLYKYEILQMKAQFVKDVHGTIWFTYAQNIRARPARDAEGENEEKQRNIKRIND